VVIPEALRRPSPPRLTASNQRFRALLRLLFSARPRTILVADTAKGEML
jgi:hypothetical protein